MSPSTEGPEPTEKATYLTVKEAAKKYKISTKMILILCADGRLPHYRIGRKGKRGRIIIIEKEFDEMLKQHRVEAHPLSRISKAG